MSHHPDRLFLAVLIAFALALIALGVVASLVVLAASATLLTGATLLAATFGLTFLLLSLFLRSPRLTHAALLGMPSVKPPSP
jgi:hypothetical protein